MRGRRPEPRPRPGPVAWLLTYPDTYEIGLPNQGLQILYEILNERPDAVAERAYAPWTDLEALLRRHGLPLFSVDTHRPAAEFDVLAFNLSAELVYTNVLNCIDLAGVPVRAADRAAEHPLVGAGGHCTYNPEPLADFLDFVVLGDGEEVVCEITEVVGDVEGAAAAPTGRASACCATSPGSPGVYVPSLYEVELRRRRPRGGHAALRRRARAWSRSAPIADLAEWPYPKQPARAAHRGRARPAQRRGVPGLHPRLSVLPGRDDHPPGARASGRAGPARWSPTGLRRTGYDEVALTSLSTADFSGIEDVVRDIVDDPTTVRPHRRCRLPSLRVDAFTVGIAAQIQQGPAHRPHVRARGGHVAHAPGHQQAHPRGRPLRRGRARPTRRAGGG